MSRRWAVLAVAALIASVAGFLLLFERFEETVHSGPRGEARFNDYLALERLIEELGLPVTASRNPLLLPPTDHVLLLVTPVRPPAETYADRLVAWVEAGGHLVATPEGWPAGVREEAAGEPTGERDGGRDGEGDGEQDGGRNGVQERANGGGEEASEESGEESGEEAGEEETRGRRSAEYKPTVPGAGTAAREKGAPSERPPPAAPGAEGPADETKPAHGTDTPDAAPADAGIPGSVPADAAEAEEEAGADGAGAGEDGDGAETEVPDAAAEDGEEGEDRETSFLDHLLGDDPLFDRLGVIVAPAIRGAPGLTELAPTAGTAPLRVELASDLRLLPVVGSGALLHAAGPRSAPVLLQIERGDGRVTLLADGTPLTNAHLGDHDHARLAWALLAPEAVPAGVWVADWRVAPGLFDLLLRHAGAALAAAAVLLALWLWRSAARFGPPLPASPGGRRSLREHVEAAGGFLWRQGGGDELAAACRRAVARRAEVHFPGWSRLPRREQVARLAEVSRLSPGAVARALDEEIPAGADAHHFTRTVHILEMIRRSL